MRIGPGRLSPGATYTRLKIQGLGGRRGWSTKLGHPPCWEEEGKAEEEEELRRRLVAREEGGEEEAEQCHHCLVAEAVAVAVAEQELLVYHFPWWEEAEEAAALHRSAEAVEEGGDLHRCSPVAVAEEEEGELHRCSTVAVAVAAAGAATNRYTIPLLQGEAEEGGWGRRLSSPRLRCFPSRPDSVGASRRPLRSWHQR